MLPPCPSTSLPVSHEEPQRRYMYCTRTRVSLKNYQIKLGKSALKHLPAVKNLGCILSNFRLLFKCFPNSDGYAALQSSQWEGEVGVGGKRMFKEVLVVAGLNSEVLYSEAIMS